MRARLRRRAAASQTQRKLMSYKRLDFRVIWKIDSGIIVLPYMGIESIVACAFH